MRTLASPIIALLASACDRTPEPIYLSDFDLTLRPVVAGNDGLLDTAPEVTLAIAEANQPPQWVPLADADGGLPAYEQVRVGVVFSEQALGPAGPETATVRGWGEIGPVDLQTGESQLPIRVGTVGGLGEVGALDLSALTLQPAAAMTADGHAWFFGGTPAVLSGDDPYAGESRDTILHVPTLDADDLNQPGIGSLPALPSGVKARVGLTATPIDTDEGERILITGGRAVWSLDGDLTQIATSDAFLFDPTTERPTDWRGTLFQPRSGHMAFRLGSGRVVLVGGSLAGNPVGCAELGCATYEVYDPDRQRFDNGTANLDVGALALAGADLGVRGLLLCGGAVRSGNANPIRLVGVDACNRVDLNGMALAAAGLPGGVGVQNHAMASVSGGALLTGGVTDDVALLGSAEATDAAWLYDAAANSWRVIAPMTYARAGHALIPMPDGRIAVVGGSTRQLFAAAS